MPIRPIAAPPVAAPLLVKTRAAARLLGITDDAFLKMARSTPGFPKPLGDGRRGAPLFWPMEKVTAFIDAYTEGTTAQK